MLRSAVLIFSFTLLAIGAGLCVTGLSHFGGIQALVTGAILVIGTLFERWRYNNKYAGFDGDWQVTGERFVDPETGKNMEVLYDPRSGERRYQEIGG